jgi:hypothetical protein
MTLLFCCSAQTISTVNPRVLAPGERITVTGSSLSLCSTTNLDARIGNFSAAVASSASSTVVLTMPPFGSGTFLPLVLTFKCRTPNIVATAPFSMWISYKIVLTSVYPNVAPSNSLVTVTGNNFANSCSFQVSNLNGACTVVSATSVVAVVPFQNGALLDVSVTSNGASQIIRSAFSYPPSLSSVQPSTLYKTGSKLTVYGDSFAGPCAFATIVISSVNVSAVCEVATVKSIVLTYFPVVWPSSSLPPVLVTATINSVSTTRSFSMLISDAATTPAGPSTASASGSSIAPIIIGSIFASAVLILACVFVIARKKGLWCFDKHGLRRSNSVRLENPPAYAPSEQPVGPIQLQFTGPNSFERNMASAPPSDSVERQWAGYMAAYDVRQQQHMGGSAAGSVANSVPQMFASAAPMEISFQEMASAPPSDTVQRQYGLPASNALHAYNQAVAFEQT